VIIAVGISRKFCIIEDGAKEEKMKKIIVLVIAMLFVLCPNTVYAETMTYDVYVNHVKQPFTGIMAEELLLPVKETYDLLGSKYSYDKKFDADVYKFADYVVEDYIEDRAIYASGAYLGEVIYVDGIRYGNKDIFDIEGVTIVVDVDNQSVQFFTKGYLETILIHETDELKKVSPDLVNAINTLLLSGTEMKFNVNTTFTSIPTDEDVSEKNTYERVFINVDGSGYGELKNQTCDIVFNVKLDKDNMARRVKGFEMRIVDEMLYVMDPTNKNWVQERFDEKLGEISALSLTHADTLFIATLREHLNKTVLENGKVNYSVMLDKEILEGFSNESAYGNIVTAIKEEMKNKNKNYDLLDLEISFVLDGDEMDVIHIEMVAKEIKSDGQVKMNIAVDLEFSNQGVEKKIVSPIRK